MKYRRHFFVCITNRPPFARPSCGARNAQDLLQALGDEIAALGLGAEVGLSGSTCLGPCETGPTVVVYPEGTWYRRVRPEDAAEIVRSHARDGIPVARLLDTPAASA